MMESRKVIPLFKASQKLDLKSDGKSLTAEFAEYAKSPLKLNTTITKNMLNNNETWEASKINWSQGTPEGEGELTVD